MKRVIITLTSVVSAMLMLASCNNENSNAKGSERSDSDTHEMIAKGGNDVAPEFREGARLVNSNDCITCHKVSDTSVGPSFTSIANKYGQTDASVNNLIVSVQKGATGQWGTQVMTPHPNLSHQDLDKMIRFILSNKKN